MRQALAALHRLAARVGRPLREGNAPIAAALLLLAAAATLPPFALPRSTYDYLVTFDVTQSMNVEDMTVDGRSARRIDAARAATREVLRRLPCGSRIGWAVFADYRVLPQLLPLEVCAHYEELLASLERIDGRMRWANASNVGKGVSWAIRSARDIDPSTRVVFFSDGHESPPLRPGETPPIHDITPGAIGGWVIGVGSERAVPIPREDREGRPVGWWRAEDVVQRFDVPTAQSHEHLSELREPHLRALAEMMGLGYRRLDDGAGLAAAMLDPALAHRAPVATDLRWLPALLALGLLAWRFAPDGLRLRRCH